MQCALIRLAHIGSYGVYPIGDCAWHMSIAELRLLPLHPLC